MLNDKIIYKNKFVKKFEEKKSESAIVNLINILLEIWDRDSATKKKAGQTMKLRA